MPRLGLNGLLRTLKTSGVRRYVADKGRVEVEFWTPAADAGDEVEAERPEGEARHVDAKGGYRDPIRAAMAEAFPPIEDGDEPAEEAN